ncbi:hypothetical protein IAT38_001600 [Cryptococcus sp. DSM 104549]
MTTTTPTPVTLVGATGLTGSHSLLAFLASPSPFSITTITRRPLPSTLTPAPTNPLTKLTKRVVTDLYAVPEGEEPVGAKGGVFVTCLATKRDTGNAERERLDLGLNRDLAKRAREDGAETAIVVSGAYASPDSRFFYVRIKGMLDEAIMGMGFSHTIILRPGMILGDRPKYGFMEAVFQYGFGGAKAVGIPVDSMAVHSDDIGACIAHLAVHPPEEKVHIIGNHEIIAYAKQYRATQASAAP